MSTIFILHIFSLISIYHFDDSETVQKTAPAQSLSAPVSRGSRYGSPSANHSPSSLPTFCREAAEKAL